MNRWRLRPGSKVVIRDPDNDTGLDGCQGTVHRPSPLIRGLWIVLVVDDRGDSHEVTLGDWEMLEVG